MYLLVPTCTYLYLVNPCQSLSQSQCLVACEVVVGTTHREAMEVEVVATMHKEVVEEASTV